MKLLALLLLFVLVLSLLYLIIFNPNVILILTVSVLSLLIGITFYECNTSNTSNNISNIEVYYQNIDYDNRRKACNNNRDPNTFFQIEQIKQKDLPPSLSNHKVYVVRDDLLCGGTKSRLIDLYMNKLYPNIEEFVYPSSWYGGAQVALAYGANKHNKKVTIITKPITNLNYTPAFIKIAEEIGGDNIKYIYNNNPQTYIHQYVADSTSKVKRHHVANGLGTPLTIDHLSTIIKDHLSKSVLQNKKFDECWCAVGSETLIKSLYTADIADKYYGGCVFNQTMQFQKDNVECIDTKISFEVVSEDHPPFPSASHYDAKVWKLLIDKQRDDTPSKNILFWNVM